ncbi:MAG TPA: NAD(P)-binding domain-containing protein [Acidobacteriota bacterium]|nr:NAD(P)-binding domain-containing protein [Acidobacteriota bacterium]
MRYLSASDLDLALPIDAAIDAMEAVFRAAAREQTDVPERAVIRGVRSDGSESLLLTMPAAWQGRGSGAKVNSFISDNPSRGLAAVQGIAVLFDTESGSPVLLTDAAALTVRRTAAMAGLATRFLARADAARLAIIGTGALAADMIAAVCSVRPVETIVAFNRTPAKAEALVDSLAISGAVAATPEDAARDADVLVLATSSTTPVVANEAIVPGTHINAVGNFSPRGSELPLATVARCAVFVDSYDGALSEAGDLILAAEHDLIPIGRAGIRGDLAELSVGTAPRRSSAQEITLFKSVGTALADLGALWAANQMASALDIGRRLG